MKFSKSLLALCAIAALAPLATAQKGATPVDLGTLGGSSSYATAINSGDITVGAGNVFSDAVQHGFYTNSLGYIQDIGSLIGVYGNSAATGVSTQGVVVGTSDQIIDTSGDIATHAFYYQSSRTGLQDVGTNGGTLSYASAIQNAIVVGYATVADDVAYCAFYWTKTKGMTNLSTLAADSCNDGYNSYAYGMNSKGVAVGSSDSTDGTTHAAAWNLKTKVIYDLGTLGGSLAQLNAVNSSNMMVGFSSLPGDSQIDATANTGLTLVDIGNLGGSYAASTAVNDSGTVVGFSNITGDTDVHAFVWTQGGGMVDLNTLLPAGSAFTELSAANGIAADGTIVGVGISAIDGQPHAFAW